jgi:hypothetical protein
VLEGWVRQQWIELGERRWNPHQAKLVVLEGPPIPVEQLSMGRGWRTALRQSREVTAELLTAVGREASRMGAEEPRAQEGAPRTGESDSGADLDLLADSLGLELLARIGAEQAPLRRVWELARAQRPDARASESLALAERAVRSLLRGRLIVLLGGSPEGAPRELEGEEAERTLGAVESWAGGGQQQAAQVWVRRA